MSSILNRDADIWEVTLLHDFDLYEEELPPGLPFDRMSGLLNATETIPADRVRLVKTDL